MNEGVMIVMVVFATIVFCSFFKFAYRVIALFVDKRQAAVPVVEVLNEDQTELNQRAYELSRRMQNLEEILSPKGGSHG
ncbi:MAG: hypothetical protein KDC71_08210 [Acidobacteria bacterium]|nr:hypothetical protein [Acidobacteriota bacterium]